MALIELNNISRIYKDGQVNVQALKEINISIEDGDFVSIMGPSGSGKSTLLNIIGCLDKPSSGSYCLDNKQVEKLNDWNLANIRNKFIGFTFFKLNKYFIIPVDIKCQYCVSRQKPEGAAYFADVPEYPCQ